MSKSPQLSMLKLSFPSGKVLSASQSSPYIISTVHSGKSKSFGHREDLIALNLEQLYPKIELNAFKSNEYPQYLKTLKKGAQCIS